MPVLINEVWMAVAIDPEDSTEGVCAIRLGYEWYPLMAADKTRLPFVKEQAKLLSAELKKTIKLVKFTTREVIEVYEGKSQP